MHDLVARNEQPVALVVQLSKFAMSNIQCNCHRNCNLLIRLDIHIIKMDFDDERDLSESKCEFCGCNGNHDPHMSLAQRLEEFQQQNIMMFTRIMEAIQPKNDSRLMDSDFDVKNLPCQNIQKLLELNVLCECKPNVKKILVIISAISLLVMFILFMLFILFMFMFVHFFFLGIQISSLLLLHKR